MAYIRLLEENDAQGTVADDFAFLAASYSHFGGRSVRAPQVYRPASLIPTYFRFGTIQNRVLTADGRHDRPEGSLPRILLNFGVSRSSTCFY